VARFAVDGIGAAFTALGYLSGAGFALAVMLIAGGVLACHSRGVSELRARFAAPAALLAGAVVFLVVTGVGRATVLANATGQTYSESRYVYVVAAMLLPALLVAAQDLVRRSALLGPLVLTALVIGVPGNVGLIVDKAAEDAPSAQRYRNFILALPRLPIAAQVPQTIHPDPTYDPWVTVGWLRSGVRSGRIPPPGPIAPAQIAAITMHLAWQPAPGPASGRCDDVVLPATVSVDKGSSLTSVGAIDITDLVANGVNSTPIVLSGFAPQNTFVTYGTFTIRIDPTHRGQTAAVCGPAGANHAS
jgi:hypothetical protein